MAVSPAVRMAVDVVSMPMQDADTRTTHVRVTVAARTGSQAGWRAGGPLVVESGVAPVLARHCTPGTMGRCNARPLPAHCSTHVASAFGMRFKSSNVNANGLDTSPSTVSFQVAGSGIAGTQ